MEIARSRILIVMLLFVYAFLVLFMSEILTVSEGQSEEMDRLEKRRTYTLSHIMNGHYRMKAMDRVDEEITTDRLFITHL